MKKSLRDQSRFDSAEFQDKLRYYHTIPKVYGNHAPYVTGFLGVMISAIAVWFSFTARDVAAMAHPGPVIFMQDYRWFVLVPLLAVTFGSIAYGFVRARQVERRWKAEGAPLERDLMKLVRQGLIERYDVADIRLVQYPEWFLDLLIQPAASPDQAEVVVTTHDYRELRYIVRVTDEGITLIGSADIDSVAAGTSPQSFLRTP